MLPPEAPISEKEEARRPDELQCYEWASAGFFCNRVAVTLFRRSMRSLASRTLFLNMRFIHLSLITEANHVYAIQISSSSFLGAVPSPDVFIHCFKVSHWAREGK